MLMSHRKAVWVMVAAALLWSIAGVVSRHLEAARGFEVTYWRSAFNALALVVLLTVYHVACGWIVRQFAAGRNSRGHVFYRWFNELPVVVLFGSVILVVVKPF